MAKIKPRKKIPADKLNMELLEKMTATAPTAIPSKQKPPPKKLPACPKCGQKMPAKNVGKKRKLEIPVSPDLT